MPTQGQVLAFIRWLIATGGAFAVGRGWITPDQVQLILPAAVAVFPLIWSFAVHSDKGTLAAAQVVIEAKQAQPPKD